MGKVFERAAMDKDSVVAKEVNSFAATKTSAIGWGNNATATANGPSGSTAVDENSDTAMADQ